MLLVLLDGFGNANALFLIQHAFLILSNLDLMVSDFIPVDLARAEIHRCLVEAFLVLVLCGNHCSQDLRNIFVAVVVLCDERFLEAWHTRNRVTVSF